MRKVLDNIKTLHFDYFLGKLIVAIGIFLRLRQYFVNRSLWIDESALALNIVNRTFGSLLLPLDYSQGAPIGFLFIEKLSILGLGNHDFILRLFPLFSGILAVYLMHRVADKHFGRFGIIAVLIFSVSGSMVYYSSELKQYSSDVMITLLLLYLAFLCMGQAASVRNIILLGLTGIVSIWISHPSAFVLPVIGILLFIEGTLRKNYLQVRWLIAVGVAWGASFLLTYMISLRHLIGDTFLQDYWQNSYAPLPPWEHLDWYRSVFISSLPQVSPSFLPYIIPDFQQEYLFVGCLALVLIGVVSLFLRDKKLGFLIVSPMLMTFIASAMDRYPMSDRFLFFLFPLLLLLLAEGSGRLYSICARLNSKVALVIYVLIASIVLWTPLTNAFYNVLHPPMGEDIKPVLAYIQAHKQENDFIYVHNGSQFPFLYYASFYGLDTTENTFVSEKSYNIKRFTVDVVDYQGSDRVWFVFSHIVSCDCNGNSFTERIQPFLQILDQHGVLLDYFGASRAATYLYNLYP